MCKKKIYDEMSAALEIIDQITHINQPCNCSKSASLQEQMHVFPLTYNIQEFCKRISRHELILERSQYPF